MRWLGILACWGLASEKEPVKHSWGVRAGPSAGDLFAADNEARIRAGESFAVDDEGFLVHGVPSLPASELRTTVENCWDDDFTFQSCCNIMWDKDHWLEILDGERDPVGNVKCWIEEFSYKRCCTYVANWDSTPPWWSTHFLWLVELPDPIRNTSYLKVVNGHVLQRLTWLETNGEFLPLVGPGTRFGTFPADQEMLTFGEGVLWSGGNPLLQLWISSFNFDFKVDASRIFLELSSGVGVASFVALAMGFSVWSSDVRDTNAWQRVAGAQATFGKGASELQRLQTPTVDLFNMSTWPIEKFDVILLTSSFEPEIDSQKLCHGFRLLSSKCLKPQGVALFLKLQTIEYEYYREYLYSCMQPDHFHSVSAHRLDADFRWENRWDLGWPMPIEDWLVGAVVLSIRLRS